MYDGPILKEPKRISTSKLALLFLGGFMAAGITLITYCSFQEPNPVKQPGIKTQIAKSIDSLFSVEKDVLINDENNFKDYEYKDSIQTKPLATDKELTKLVTEYLTDPTLNVENDEVLWNQVKTNEGVLTKGVLILGENRYTFSFKQTHENNARLAISQRIDGTHSKEDLISYFDEPLDGMIDGTDSKDVFKTQKMYDDFRSRAIEHYQK